MCVCACVCACVCVCVGGDDCFVRHGAEQVYQLLCRRCTMKQEMILRNIYISAIASTVLTVCVDWLTDSGFYSTAAWTLGRLFHIASGGFSTTHETEVFTHLHVCVCVCVCVCVI